MTKNQIVKADEWRIKHKEHVMKLVQGEKGFGYPPSDEDVNHPELWKPAHWKWFLINC